MKKLVKIILFKSGILKLIHRFKNKNTLTIIMLHRVLPENLISEYGANPEWTMTPEILESFFLFIKKFYNPVSAKQVEEHINQGSCLPPNAILITFDDGWQDNFEYADDVLSRQKIPSLIFIVSNTINQKLPFWQELIYSCCTINNKHFVHCKKLLGSPNDANLLSFINSLECETNQDKVELVINYCKDNSQHLNRQILSEKEIYLLSEKRIEIGSHGATHNKLGTLTSKEQIHEVTQSKKRLEEITHKPVSFISFPHGSSNKNTDKICHDAGYKLWFNSHVALNKTHNLKKELARIHVSQNNISNNNHIFNEMKACYRLFFLDHI